MADLEVSRTDDTARVVPRGDLTKASAGALWSALSKLVADKNVRRVEVDFANVGQVDTAGVAVIARIGRRLDATDRRLRLTQLDDEHRSAFDLAPATRNKKKRRRRKRSRELAERVGVGVRLLYDRSAQSAELVVDTAASALSGAVGTRRRMSGGRIVEQTARLGADAFPIVAMLSVVLGAVLAMQSVDQLGRFGAELYVADFLGVAMIREFSPLLTAVILTGRSGAAIAAELGTMEVRDEIRALKTMGIGVPRFLLVPRITALTIAGPSLTLLSIAFGLGAGLLFLSSIGVPLSTSWSRVSESVLTSDLWMGLTKSILFAWIVGFAGIVCDLNTRGSATGVGESTTRAVVSGIFLIIVTDGIFTTITTLVRHV